MNEDSAKIEVRLAELLNDFLLEIGAESAVKRIHLKADLEADLGIDSLGRIEFLHRVEKEFETRFPTKQFAELNCIADIIDYIGASAPQSEISKKKIKTKSAPRSIKPAAEADTIIDRFMSYVDKDPERTQIYYLDEEDNEIPLSYKDIYDAASETASGLISRGLHKYETVAIMLPTGIDFFAAFLGILMAGAIPVPIYPPFRPDRIEEYIKREAHTLQNAQASFLITFGEAQILSRLLKGFIPTLRHVITVDALRKEKSKARPLRISSSDPAFIQYTSGSTGDPKGVMLSHGNLLANIKSIGEALEVKPEDRVVSWLPLYHDMGLIGCFLGSLYYGLPLTIMSPLSFISRPSRWLWAIHTYQATISCAPNFAYEICTRKIKDEDIEGLDLSSWRIAANGAEMVFADTLRKFDKRFSNYGFKKSSMFPVYGLAENTVALAFPPLDRAEPRIDLIKRGPLEKKGIAEAASKQDKDTTEFVACGKPIPHHEIKIVDDDGNELPERKVGRLLFKGPSMMKGYYNNPRETKRITHDGWIDSSDYAYKAEGDIFLTGRVKDLIIKAGRNIYPQDIEDVAEKIEGVRKGCVAAIGVVDVIDRTEKLVVVAETVETNQQKRDHMSHQITTSIVSNLGLPPDEVLLVPPHTVPKTSSGKMQRSACKALYEEGKLTKKHLPVWLQLARISLKSLTAKVIRISKKLIDILYTSYVAILGLVLIIPAVLTIFIPPRKIAQKFAKFWMRLFLMLTLPTIYTHNIERLFRKGPTIYVSNHASYLDSLILTAFLPYGVSFVGKAELFNFLPFKWLMNKLGHHIVERGDIIKGLSDLESMSTHLQAGQSLLIYPEGTFTYIPGLRAFKTGAYKLAVDNKVPIVTISLNGTRTLLPDLAYLLHPTRVDIYVEEAIHPEGKEWAEVIRLKKLSRDLIAQKCGESSFEEF